MWVFAAGVSPGMRCYDSAGGATQCQDGVHSCVTFVELTQSVPGNVSAGPFLNKNTRKCGTSLVFPYENGGNLPPYITEDSPMCDPDLCEVVVEIEIVEIAVENVHVLPFGPHPTLTTDHKDSRTVDPLWQYEGPDFYPGMAFHSDSGGRNTAKCVPKNTAVCFSNFKDAYLADPTLPFAGPDCEATPGCTWDAISLLTQSPRDYQYLTTSLYQITDSMGSCQASDPREFGTDKVKLANPTSVCADTTLAEDTGIVCDGPGVKVSSTGSAVYQCCRGDLCNKDTKEALVNLQVPRDVCVKIRARVCVKMFACMYVCMPVISLCVYACMHISAHSQADTLTHA